MAKSKDFDDLEEYVDYDEEYGDYEVDVDYSDGYEYEEVNTDDSTSNYEYYEDSSSDDGSNYEESNYEEFDSKSEVNLIVILEILSRWFIRLGIILAICLLIMFFITGKVMTAFLYVFGLIVAFSFGYVFMFCIDHLLSRSSEVEKF